MVRRKAIWLMTFALALVAVMTTHAGETSIKAVAAWQGPKDPSCLHAAVPPSPQLAQVLRLPGDPTQMGPFAEHATTPLHPFGMVQGPPVSPSSTSPSPSSSH